MGGIGKSTTCAQWFHRYATDHFEHIAWISCKDGIANGLAESRIYQHLSIDDNPENLINTVAHFQGKTLFVLDDIRDPNDALLKQFKNIGHSDFNLITTSRQKLPGFKQQAIGVLSPEHCLALFQQFYQTSQTELASQLIEKAGRHTLTVELIAKTMAENDISPQEMLKELETRGFDLRDTVPEEAAYVRDGEEYTEQLNQALNKLFDISELGEEHKFALFLLGHFNGAQFVKRRVKEWFSLDSLKPLNELEKLGWLSKASEQASAQKTEINFYYLHPVISDLARRIFDEELQQNQESSSGDKVNNAPGSFINSKLESRLEIKLGEAQLESTLHNIIKSLNNDNFNDTYPGDFHILQPLYQFYGYLKTPTKVLADAMHDSAFQLEKQANYQQAFELYERALATREKELGPEHPDVATTLNNLAGLYESKGDYDAALPLYKRALAIREKALGPEHPYVATTLNNLAGLYRAKGDDDAALPLYERALAISEKALGLEHPDVATTLNNLAGLYESKGNYDAALPLYERALAIREKALGPEHPDVATTLNNLAGLYRVKGDYGEAVPLFVRSLNILNKKLGNQHQHTQQGAINFLRCFEAFQKSIQGEEVLKNGLRVDEDELKRALMLALAILMQSEESK